MDLAAKSGKTARSSLWDQTEKLLINLFFHVILNSFQIYRSLIMKYGFLTDASD